MTEGAGYDPEINIMSLCAEHGYSASTVYLEDEVNLTTWTLGIVVIVVCSWELFFRCLGYVRTKKHRVAGTGMRSVP